ncbi:MAG TPA: glycosyltransferase family 4 protein [Actinomycetota bacterium]
MRVTILGRDFPPAVGGIGDHTDLLAAELARRGQAVTVVCSAPADARASFDVRPVIDRWDARGSASIVRAVAGSRPDIIVWQYNPFAVGRRGLTPGIGRLARALAAEAPLVLLAHELWFPFRREGLKGLVWALAHRRQMRALARAARMVVVTTEQRAAELARAIPSVASTTRVIPIAANVEPRPEQRSARATFGLPDDAFVVAHLGSVGPGREIDRVFDAVAELRARGLDVRLLLAGNTGPFTAPGSLNGAVITTGILSREQLSAALASADAYVHPDLVGPSAGRRGSLVAALAHSLPVVAFRGPDHASQLLDGTNVVITDPDELSDALAGLASDRARATQIGDAARQTYLEHFAWPRVGDELLAVFEETLR